MTRIPLKQVTLTVVVAMLDVLGILAQSGAKVRGRCAAWLHDLASSCLRSQTRTTLIDGGAVLLWGPDAIHTVDTVLALEAAVRRSEHQFVLHAGIDLGLVVQRDDELFGSTVNVAARVAASARPSRILCTQPVRDALASEARLRVEPSLPVRFGNNHRPTQLFEIATRAPVADFVVDPVCKVHLDPRTCGFSLEYTTGRRFFCSERCQRAFASRLCANAARSPAQGERESQPTR